MPPGDSVGASKKKMAYGCIFCLTGKEIAVAADIQRRCAQIRAIAVRQNKRFTHGGVTTLREVVLLYGYVLLEAPENAVLHEALKQVDSITILTDTDGDWRLYGKDEDYARWAFSYHGLIGLSRAYRVGEQIQIVDGPLKDLEGKISRIDRRNRSGQVTLQFWGKEIKVWLGFEIIEEHTANERPLASGLLSAQNGI